MTDIHVDTLTTDPTEVTTFMLDVKLQSTTSKPNKPTGISTTVHSEPVVTTTSMPTEPVEFLIHKGASVNFTRPWVDYRNGFGNSDMNYWMGLDRLHTLTSSRAYGLSIYMTARNGTLLWAEYDKFSVGPESGNYILNVAGYDSDSTLPDVVQYQNGAMFSTYDRDNDWWVTGNCARERKGGWWYSDCLCANPTGLYTQTCRFGEPLQMVPCNFIMTVWSAISTTDPVVTTTSMSTEPVVTNISIPAGPVVFLHRQDASINFTKPWID